MLAGRSSSSSGSCGRTAGQPGRATSRRSRSRFSPARGPSAVLLPNVSCWVSKEAPMPTATKKKITTPRSKRSGPARRVTDPHGASLLLQERLERLVTELGSNRVASLLGVNRSQPTRWRSGDERISADKQRSLLDLDYVMARLLQLFPREQAEI